ncbi:MAG TPA: hypothetical protein VGC56_13070 [Allosphingosinicella sp.]
MFEVEVQNETCQTQSTMKFVVLPRIGEGVQLLAPDGFWASYDVVDVWYQRAQYGDVWVPYLHVRKTPDSDTSRVQEPSPVTRPPGPAH